MKLKLSDIHNAKETLKYLTNLNMIWKDDKKVPIPFQTSYRIKKLRKKIKDEVEFIEEKHNELVTKYGKKTENGVPHIAPEDTKELESYFNDFNEMLKTEVDVDIQKLDFTMLESLGLSAKQLEDIEVFTEEEGVAPVQKKQKTVVQKKVS